MIQCQNGGFRRQKKRMLGKKVDKSMVCGEVAPGFEEVERALIENFDREPR
jgi:hypothetical protein